METLDEKINEAACRAQEIAAIAQCVVMLVESRRECDTYISGALYGVISMCHSLQGDLSKLASNVCSPK